MNNREKVTKYDAVLDAAAIDECSLRVSEFLKDKKADRQTVLRYSLAIEEALLKTLDKNEGNEVHVSLTTGIRFFRPFILLAVDGKDENLFFEKSKGVLQDSILKNVGIVPDYSYSGGKNVYTFHLPKKEKNTLLLLLFAVILALIVGYVGLMLPDEVREIFGSILTMLHDTFLNMLGAAAGPMIFFSVAWGIYGIGDAATFQQIGKKMILGYSGSIFIATFGCGFLALPFFSLLSSGEGATFGQVTGVLELIFGIVPKNIVAPFYEGNTLQIIFLATVFGVALLFLEKKTLSVAKATEQLNQVVQFIIEFISKLIPPFVFIVVTDMIWSSTTSVLFSVGKLILALTAAILLSACVVIGFTSIRNKVSPILLIKKGLPTLMVGVSTASSAAAFGSNIKACRDEFGVPENLYSFGLPLGIVMFKLSSGLQYMMLGLFMAEEYKVPMSMSRIVILFFITGIIAIATPPIPGGSVIAYTMLVSIMGYPEEAIVIALASDAILDFIVTGFDQFMMPFVLLNLSTKLHLTDRNILLKKK